MELKSFLEDVAGSIDNKDAKKFASFITPDGQFRFGNAPAAHGTEAIEQVVDWFFTTIKSSKHEILKTWVDEDGHIVWQGRVTYTRLDDKVVPVEFVNIFNMEGDKIKDYLIYIDNSPLTAE
jgi:limonene-1,2-epoxide hydrolase